MSRNSSLRFVPSVESFEDRFNLSTVGTHLLYQDITIPAATSSRWDGSVWAPHWESASGSRVADDVWVDGKIIMAESVDRSTKNVDRVVLSSMAFPSAEVDPTNPNVVYVGGSRYCNATRGEANHLSPDATRPDSAQTIEQTRQTSVVVELSTSSTASIGNPNDMFTNGDRTEPILIGVLLPAVQKMPL